MADLIVLEPSVVSPIVRSNKLMLTRSCLCGAQTSEERAVETTDLTSAFGWNASDSYEQQDVSELLVLLYDALELKFKDTPQVRDEPSAAVLLRPQSLALRAQRVALAPCLCFRQPVLRSSATTTGSSAVL